MKFFKVTMLCGIAMASLSAQAEDARSLALGGTGITNGKGVGGAMVNPALLAKQKDQGLKGSFRAGFGVGVYDSENLAEEIENAEDIIDKLDKEAKILEKKSKTDSATIITNKECFNSNDDSEVCATGLTDLRSAAKDVNALLQNIDGKPLGLGLDSNVGFSYLGATIPFAVNFAVDAKVSGNFDLNEVDQAYFDTFTAHSGDIDTLTVADIKNNDKISIDADGELSIGTDKDYEIKSSVNSFAIVNAETSVSVAKDFDYNDDTLYFGLTPRLIQVAAGSLDVDVDDDDMDSDELEKRFEDSQVEETNFSLDAGFLYQIPEIKGMSIGAVVTDIVPHSIETKATDSQEAFEIKTEPQAKVGIGYENNYYNISADMAVNPAKHNGVETRMVGLGAELNLSWFGVRAGVSHDLAAHKNGTSYSVGLDLGLIEIGAKLNEESTAEVSTQIAFEF